jgi:hypothetical protein
VGLPNNKEVSLCRYDPVFCQIGAAAGADSKIMKQRLDAHDVFFTLGEGLSANDAIPKLERKWNTTKYPIVSITGAMTHRAEMDLPPS